MLDVEFENYISSKTKEFGKYNEGCIQDVEQDFSNALDVLMCFLHERNHNLITELKSVSDRKTDLILLAYKSGLIEGINHKKSAIS